MVSTIKWYHEMINGTEVGFNSSSFLSITLHNHHMAILKPHLILGYLILYFVFFILYFVFRILNFVFCIAGDDTNPI